MQLADFSYDLPEHLIARYPLPERSASRLLYLPVHGQVQDLRVKALPELLNAGDVLVLNDTRVMKARLHGQKASGGVVEVLVERVLAEQIVLAHVRSSNTPKTGMVLALANGQLQAEVLGRRDNLFELQFDQPVLSALEQYGELPIPPYFHRDADASDESRYQTVFHDPAKTASVAAPTAGLHMDDVLLAQLQAKGVQLAYVTLHVGAGTFQPVRTADITQHQMHSEWGEVPAATVSKIAQAKAVGGKVIAVGTTATRALESAARACDVVNGGSLAAWSGETSIFIYPSYQFQVIDRLMTNFHLPESTLLMLVSALAGRDRIMAAYQHAIAQEYRFFSYGDAMLIDRVSA
ncbi:MAG: tRNA preQ1(34) S-adenosylmethionine ribosyltransferase-isomerase QueA [Pseudomonadota bacterium]|nr:tRNA preQ1(34) S-adenosylmethionine ribosyltransferase-isomerase QueA [Pseudomonadota bacterium]